MVFYYTTIKEEVIGHFDGYLKWENCFVPFNSQYLRNLLKNSFLSCAQKFDIWNFTHSSFFDHKGIPYYCNNAKTNSPILGVMLIL